MMISSWRNNECAIDTECGLAFMVKSLNMFCFRRKVITVCPGSCYAKGKFFNQIRKKWAFLHLGDILPQC